jgi:hypothetical protein
MDLKAMQKLVRIYKTNDYVGTEHDKNLMGVSLKHEISKCKKFRSFSYLVCFSVSWKYSMDTKIML